MRKIHKESDDYPENLKELLDAPEFIFCEGTFLSGDSKAVAIVGTRTPTRYGIEVAKEFAYELAKKGITIVSGMARGIDTVAHKSALKAGGRTIAVLANGLDIIYPPENVRLFKEIVSNGVAVSEFPSGTRPLPKNFLSRNRVVSGLSLGVLIVEGRRRSGTLSTATHAANQGKEVFAIPGPVNSKLSEAPLYLIEQGATVAKTPQDILDLLI